MAALKVVHALALATVHAAVVNKLEKQFVQLRWGHHEWTMRPTPMCKASNDPSCFGMPSGHAEFATITLGLLYLWGVVPPSLAVIGILLMGLQRVLWNRHTVLQVVIGTLIGYFYVILYQ